MKEDVV